MGGEFNGRLLVEEVPRPVGILRFLVRVVGLAVVLSLFAGDSDARVTATATRDLGDETRLTVLARVDLTVRRPLRRHVFVEACPLEGGALVCVDAPTRRLVKLRKGRNRITVRLQVQAAAHGYDPPPPGWDWARAAWHPDGLIPARADVAQLWVGQDPTVQEIRPVGAAAARETLKDGRSTP